MNNNQITRKSISHTQEVRLCWFFGQRLFGELVCGVGVCVCVGFVFKTIDFCFVQILSELSIIAKHIPFHFYFSIV